MKEQNLNIRYMVAQLSELSQQEQELVNRAKAATSNAYANYSHFYVGAALLLGDGRIVIGANQENAAFPSGLCAERSAIFGAQSNYPDQPILTLAKKLPQRPQPCPMRKPMPARSNMGSTGTPRHLQARPPNTKAPMMPP